MRKIATLWILLALFSFFALISCGGGETESTTTEDPAALQVEAEQLEAEAIDLDKAKTEIEEKEAELEELLEDL